MRSRSIVEAFRFAFSGLWYTLRTQPNMRIHLAAAAAVVVLGLWLEISGHQWAILALTNGLVLVTEMTNTVVEQLVNVVCPDYHPMAKVIKDVMAGAVVLSATVAIIVGLLVLGPALWDKLAG
ncbi:MAG: diacylglycerol kinase family protein [Chloroflexota bacterium]